VIFMKFRIFLYVVISVLLLSSLFVACKHSNNNKVLLEPYSNYPEGIYFHYIGPSNLTLPMVVVSTRKFTFEEVAQFEPSFFGYPDPFVVSEDNLKEMKTKTRVLLLSSKTDFDFKKSYPEFEILVLDKYTKNIQMVNDQDYKHIWEIIEKVSYKNNDELYKLAKRIVQVN
jgi:hypothetical protein